MRSLLVSVLSIAFVAAAAAQTDESEITRVQRDQSRIAQRLQSLQEKMERLAVRYTEEGREGNARLLREALARMESEALLEQTRLVEQSLDSGLLGTVEQQDKLSVSLEAIYAVLRDRSDTQAAEERVELIDQATTELSALAEDQRRLLTETRAASDTPGELIDGALAVGERMRAELAAALGSTAELEAANQALGEARQAAALAEAQRVLAQRSGEAGADAVQRELSAALDELRESLARELGEAAGAGAEGEGQADAEGAEGVSSPSDAGAAGEDPKGEPASDEQRANEEARATASELARVAAEQMRAALERLKAAEADPSAAEGQGGETSGAGETTSGAESGGESGEGSQASGENAPGESDAGESDAGESESRAGTEDAVPADAPTDEPAKAASDSAQAAMEKAAEALEQAAAALGERERRLAAQRNRSRALGLASSAEALDSGEDLAELIQRLEDAEPEAGPELLDRTLEMMDELRSARAELERGRSAQALGSQEAAANDLASLMDKLRQRRDGAQDSPSSPLDEAGREALAERQADVERRLRELMGRLEELPDQDFRTPAERAQDSMSQAEQDLQSGRLEEAAAREQEAAEDLEQARERLEKERKRYDELRQEEVLFRLAEELAALLGRQAAVREETSEIDEQRGDGERLGRSQQRALARLAAEQRDLSLGAQAVSTQLEEDGAVVFVFAIQRIADDMGAVAARLEDADTGSLVQALQRGAERRLQDLLDVLGLELERRREQMQEPPGEGEPPPQPPGPAPLVPPVAELLLVQRMELMALERLETFESLFPEAAASGTLGSREMRELERWALEHVRVTELFESLAPPSPPEQAPEFHIDARDDGPSGEEEGR